MERKIDQKIEDWCKRKDHKALVIRGPRQVGKSYAVRKFGSKRYDSIIEVNFENNPEYRTIFEGDLSAEAIFERLSFAFRTPIEGNLLFLDEIQCCPDAFSALKPLAEDGRCDVICSGSVLSEIVGMTRLVPLGYVELLYMEPMDFEEFLWAQGFTHKQTDAIRSNILGMVPFDSFVLRQLNDLFRRYLVIGGMPEAVLSYSTTNRYTGSYNILDSIMRLLSDDVRRYVSDNTDKIRITQCLESIPRQLSRERNSTFQYSDVSVKSGYGQREYGPAISWLENAGIIGLCRNIEEISEPFEIKTSGNMFKIYMEDTGVLTYLLGPAVGKGIIDGDFTMNNGAVMENAIFCALSRKGYRLHYYSNTVRKMGLDFVFNFDGKLAVMEVKSGRKKSAKSLIKALSEDKAIDIAIKVSDSNVSVDENGVRHYPLFGPSFFEECKVLEPSEMTGLDELKSVLG